MANKHVPVGEMRDELARRRINKLMTELQAMAATMQGAEGSMDSVLNSLQTLTSQINGKQNAITPANAISDASTVISITLITQVASILSNTNTKVNQILAALRATGIIRTS